MEFYREKDLAVCGLACVLCSRNRCPGCKARGRAQDCECDVYQCAAEKELDGCYQCADFPCGKDMLTGIRNRAFNRYAKQYGKEALLERLRTNFESGVTYHKQDGLKGDYDLLETEEDVLRLVRYGTHNPYVKCPELHTAHFTLRLVTLEDAQDLMKCYSDPKAQRLFNSANCTSNFCFQSLNDLQEYMRLWLDSYQRQEFIRYAVVDRATGKAVGTVEMFGKLGLYKVKTGILRLDLASEYETEQYLTELFILCVKEFFLLFEVSHIVTLAVPEAEYRIASLSKCGFSKCDAPRPEYNFICDREQ